MAIAADKISHSRRSSMTSPTPSVPLNVVSLQKTYEFNPIAIPVKPDDSKTAPNTLSLCKLAPLEYKLAWEKKLQQSSGIKLKIRKKMLQKQKELEREDKMKLEREQMKVSGRRSSTDTLDENPETSNNQNLLEQLQTYFHDWLEVQGHREEIDRIHALSSVNDRQQN